MGGLGAWAVNKGQHVWPSEAVPAELPGQVTCPVWTQRSHLSDEGAGGCDCQGPTAFSPTPIVWHFPIPPSAL